MTAETDLKVDQEELQNWVTKRTEELGVPGVAVGIYSRGSEQYAFSGVTSVENPLPVDESTLWQSGSTGKTYTSTAIMRLVDQGKVDLSAPVKTYVPELKLRDQEAERTVTVLQLLNHTAGWEGDLLTSTGDGDDALERYVGLMADLEQITKPGEAFSYNNASLSLAGRLIEKVTGQVFQTAIEELIFEPLGLENSFFFPNDIMTRRFVVGHGEHPDGSVKIFRPWALPRSGDPAGGISSNSGDLIAWARFHLGDGTNREGKRVLSEELLKQMQEPTVETPGSAIGDQVGISWLLKTVEGVKLVSHGGNTLGQNSSFVIVPSKDFAVSCLSNSSPSGSQFDGELVKWALESYAGVALKDPEPAPLTDAELEKYSGRYETIAAMCAINPKNGGLVIEVDYKPEVIAKLVDEGSEPPESPPILIGLIPGEGDRYVVTEGPAKGMTGYFVRGASGEIEAIHVGGRLATRSISE